MPQRNSEEILKCKNEIKLQDFIEEELKPYLFNQTHRRLRGFYINERAHGMAGELEFYSEALGTRDKREIKRFFQFLLQREEPSRTNPCFCSSRIKYRKCHRDEYRKFAALDNNKLKEIITRLELEIT